MPEDQIETEEEEGGDASEDGGAGILSPAGILMMAVAIFFSLIGLIPVVGDFSDIAAVIVIGGLLLIMGKMDPMLIFGFLLSAVLEAIPILADIVPFLSILAMLFGIKLPISWIGFVYSVFSGIPIVSVYSGGGAAKSATGVAAGATAGGAGAGAWRGLNAAETSAAKARAAVAGSHAHTLQVLNRMNDSQKKRNEEMDKMWSLYAKLPPGPDEGFKSVARPLPRPQAAEDYIAQRRKEREREESIIQATREIKKENYRRNKNLPEETQNLIRGHNRNDK